MDTEIISLDTETGGIDFNKNSLLSVGMIMTRNGVILESKEWFVKHDTYNVTDIAMEINKIDLEAHDSIAQDQKEVIEEIIAFVKKYSKQRVILFGQNVQFDINFLQKLFADNCYSEEFEKIFHYRAIDLTSITSFLALSGMINVENAGLDELARLFKIDDVKHQRHTALYDAQITWDILQKFHALAQKGSSPLV